MLPLEHHIPFINLLTALFSCLAAGYKEKSDTYGFKGHTSPPSSQNFLCSLPVAKKVSESKEKHAYTVGVLILLLPGPYILRT